MDWEAGGEEGGCGVVCEGGSGASRASGSIEEDNEAWEDGDEDVCGPIRGFFGLPPLLLGSAGLLPLLPPVRVSPKGALKALAGPEKAQETLLQYLIFLATLPRGVSDGE